MSGAWRGWLNRWRRRLVHALLHRVVFGETFGETFGGTLGENSGGRYLPHTRIAPSTCIEHPDQLLLADHVYIGPFNFIEASAGVVIGEGVQITHHVSIVSHSSHRAQRLLGRAYVGWAGQRPGWVAGAVQIGPYCFIGPHSLIEAGSRLGRGCIVRAGSVLRGDYPEFSVIAGNPAAVVGDAREGDARWLAAQPELRAHYEAWAGTGTSAPTPAATPAATPSAPEPRP